MIRQTPCIRESRPGEMADVVHMATQPDPLILKLIEKLGDTDPRTRRNAAGALRLHGARAKAAIPALSILLGDGDPRVRSEAEMALHRLRNEAA
jgi:HEAT repeat protein